MPSSKNKSGLNTTTSSSVQGYGISFKPWQYLQRAGEKYNACNRYYTLRTINQAVQKGKSKLKDILTDQAHNDNLEHLEQYNEAEESGKELTELTEYYKYYTQTSILYQPGFFKLMHAHRERKKLAQYNRLKKLLNLSSSQADEQSETSHRPLGPLQSFRLLSNLTLSRGEEESEMFQQLESRLVRACGPQQYGSIQEADRHFYFQKKATSPTLETHFTCASVQSQKETHQGHRSRNTFKSKRNNSCESITTTAKNTIRTKIKRKQHQSMGNLREIYDRPSRGDKKRVDGWVRSPAEPHTRAKDEKGSVIKERIANLKEQIQKEKKQLRKKGGMTVCTPKTDKKLSGIYATESLKMKKTRYL